MQTPAYAPATEKALYCSLKRGNQKTLRLEGKKRCALIVQKLLCHFRVAQTRPGLRLLPREHPDSPGARDKN